MIWVSRNLPAAMSTMSDAKQQFVDTNILIYAYDLAAGEKHQMSQALLTELWSTEKACLSIQVLQEFYVNATKRSVQPLSPEKAFQVIRDLSTLPVHRPGVTDVISAIELHERYQVSFWDAMILRSAQQLGCEILLSEDLSDGQDYGGVKVVNPFKK